MRAARPGDACSPRGAALRRGRSRQHGLGATLDARPSPALRRRAAEDPKALATSLRRRRMQPGELARIERVGPAGRRPAIDQLEARLLTRRQPSATNRSKRARLEPEQPDVLRSDGLFHDGDRAEGSPLVYAERAKHRTRPAGACARNRGAAQSRPRRPSRGEPLQRRRNGGRRARCELPQLLPLGLGQRVAYPRVELGAIERAQLDARGSGAVGVRLATTTTTGSVGSSRCMNAASSCCSCSARSSHVVDHEHHGLLARRASCSLAPSASSSELSAGRSPGTTACRSSRATASRPLGRVSTTRQRCCACHLISCQQPAADRPAGPTISTSRVPA